MSGHEEGDQVIERFGPFLMEYILPSHLLPHLNHINGLRNCFSKILVKEKQGYRRDAVILLIYELQKSGDPGWYRAFCEALENEGYEYVINVLKNKATIRNQEIFKRLIDVFHKDINVRPSDLFVYLQSRGCITGDDRELIYAKETTEGAHTATMILLDAIIRKKEHWFADFMESLKLNGYQNIVEIIEPRFLEEGKSGHSLQRKMQDLYTPNEEERAICSESSVLTHRGHVRAGPDREVPLMADPALLSERQPVVPVMPRELPDGASDSLVFPVEAPGGISPQKLTAVTQSRARENESSSTADTGSGTSSYSEPSRKSVQNVSASSPVERFSDVRVHRDEKSNAMTAKSEVAGNEIDDLISRMGTGAPDDVTSSDDEDEFYPALEGDDDSFQQLKLRNYQMELAKLALEGKNVIVNAPTGSGKTLVALKIARDHLLYREGNTKVVFMVPTVSLVEQQLKMFKKYLSSFSSYGISGDSLATTKVPLGLLVDEYDIFVCTAQILVDAMKEGNVESVSIFSLLIFDECHHTMKQHPYNKIMYKYLDEKYEDGKKRLPQIVGLTASVGTGKASTVDKTVDHILEMCANLDAFYITTVQENLDELQQYSKKPNERTYAVKRKPPELDPFFSVISKIMNQIEFKMKTVEDNEPSAIAEIEHFRKSLSSPHPTKREQYTQWLSSIEKEAVCINSAKIRRVYIACIDHLKVYNSALSLNNDCRTKDGYEYIDENLPNLHGPPHGDETDLWLHRIYKGKENDLKRLSEDRALKNPKLEKLKSVIIENHENKPDSRVIVFAKTRELTVALQKWMQESRELSHLNPERLVGSQAPAVKGGMTGNQQTDVLQYFKDGKHGLIIATSVAEEGLDVSKCNLVIRYLHVTNEISRVQTMGRGRADDALYVVIAEEGSGAAEKERLNEVRQKMMKLALSKINKMKESDVKMRIEKIQKDAKTKRTLLDMVDKTKKDDASQKIYQLYCMKCSKFACYSFDLRKIEDSHHVVIDEDFRERATITEHPTPVTYGPMGSFEKTGKLLCGMCRRDKGDWGIMAIYMGAPYPVLKISSFIIEDDDGNKFTCKKWKDVPFRVEGLTSEDIAKRIKSCHKY